MWISLRVIFLLFYNPGSVSVYKVCKYIKNKENSHTCVWHGKERNYNKTGQWYKHHNNIARFCSSRYITLLLYNRDKFATLIKGTEFKSNTCYHHHYFSKQRCYVIKCIFACIAFFIFLVQIQMLFLLMFTLVVHVYSRGTISMHTRGTLFRSTHK